MKFGRGVATSERASGRLTGPSTPWACDAAALKATPPALGAAVLFEERP
jgi:hypothetical protein